MLPTCKLEWLVGTGCISDMLFLVTSQFVGPSFSQMVCQGSQQGLCVRIFLEMCKDEWAPLT